MGDAAPRARPPANGGTGRIALAALLVTVCAMPRAAGAEALRMLDEDAAATCRLAGDVVDCRYRPLDARVPSQVRVMLGDAALERLDEGPYPGPGDITAVLFVVDATHPDRAGIVRRTSEQIERILSHAKRHHRFGLAVFNRDLAVVAPMGSPADRVVRAARELQASGEVTELYRSVLMAVRHLAQFPATRRFVYLFSDGDAQDTAYFPADVVREARAGDVVIAGLGLPGSPPAGVYLQSLRRLSEETGGPYFEADANGTFPESFLARPFLTVDGGGRIRARVAAALRSNVTAETPLRLVLQFEPGGALATVSGPAQALLAETPAAPSAAAEPAGDDSIYLLVVGLGIATLAAAAFVLQRRRRAPRFDPSLDPTLDPSLDPELSRDRFGPEERTARGADTAAPDPDPDAPELADEPGLDAGVDPGLDAPELELEMDRALGTETGSDTPELAPAEDAEEASCAGDARTGTLGYLKVRNPPPGFPGRYAITKPVVQIGRATDCDLTLKDPSISRHHAEIALRRSGTFFIRDLESLNGVYVNDRKVESSPINEGDAIELGDVVLQLTFTAPGLTPEDTQVGEETLMFSSGEPADDDDPQPSPLDVGGKGG